MLVLPYLGEQRTPPSDGSRQPSSASSIRHISDPRGIRTVQTNPFNSTVCRRPVSLGPPRVPSSSNSQVGMGPVTQSGSGKLKKLHPCRSTPPLCSCNWFIVLSVEGLLLREPLTLNQNINPTAFEDIRVPRNARSIIDQGNMKVV